MSKVPGDPAATPSAANPFEHQPVDGNQVQQLVDALRKDKLVRVLAEPTMMTTNGKRGAYNSGGTLPVAASQKDGPSATRSPEYGTQAEATADVIRPRTVRLAIRLPRRRIRPRPDRPRRHREHARYQDLRVQYQQHGGYKTARPLFCPA